MNKPKQIRIQVGVLCRILTRFPELKFLYHRRFTITDPDRYHNHDYKSGKWDGTHKFMNRRGEFRIGLLAEILSFLKRRGYSVELLGISKFRVPLDWSRQNLDGHLREYQVATCQRMGKKIVGASVLPTSAGKTEIMLDFARIANKCRILYVCGTQALLKQTAKRASAYLNEPIGMVGAGSRDWDARFVCTTDRSMVNLIRAGNIPRDAFDIILIDECHHAAASGIMTIIHYFDWKRLYGFTGSFPTRERNLVKHWRIREIFGQPIVHVSDKEFNETYGKAFMPQIYIFRVLYQANVSPWARWHRIYQQLKQDSLRNNIIALIAQQLGNGVLITVNHKDHGELTLAACKRIGLETRFIDAQHSSVSMQQEALNDLNSGVLPCLIATPLVNEGLSINNIRHIIYAGGWKSEIQIIQRVGRGKRTKDRGPNRLTVWDFADRGHKRCQTNSNKRFSVYHELTDNVYDVPVPVAISGVQDCLERVFNDGVE